MSSIKKIAKITGLSTATVSHAINGTRKVSEKSMSKIKEAIRMTNYTPNLAAQIMRTHRSKCISIIIPETEPNNITNFFFFDVLNGAKSFLEEKGYELIVSTYPEYDPKKLSEISILKRRWIDGILLVPPSTDFSDIEKICSYNIPIVLIDRWVYNCSLPTVTSNNRESSKRAVKLLHRCGASKIAFIGSSLNNSSALDRFLGYRNAISELKLCLQESYICQMPKYNIENGILAAKKILKAGADSIFVANNVLCIGVLQELYNQNISIPKNISIIGFDDYAWAQITSPPLTSVTQNSNEMGRRASELLLSLIQKKSVPNTISISTTFTLRDSHNKKSFNSLDKFQFN